jgi:hypothetical protein
MMELQLRHRQIYNGLHKYGYGETLHPMGKLYTPETLPYGEQTVSPSQSDLNTLTLYDNYYYIDNPTMTVYS